MFALLPDLSPRDSHSLWYTSSRNPFPPSGAHDAHLGGPQHEHGHHGLGQQQQQQQQQPHGNSHHHHHRRVAAAHLLIERSPLARLRADEQNLERRRQNVMNFGSAWLKPPGFPKTLHQVREERREIEEHLEAVRREQLAQELAEAEAEAAGAVAGADAGDMMAGGGIGGPDVMLDAPPDGDGDEGMDDVQLDGARDLDDDIPEADAADFGLSADEDEDEDEDEDDGDEDEEEDEEEEEEGEEAEEDDDDDDNEEEDAEARIHAQQQQLMAQRMRQANDAFREDMARGRDSAAFYGADEDVDDEDQSQMLEEEDLVGGGGGGGGGMDDMGMDADLDDEIPEAESMGGYEHTDTEADLSSSGSTTDEQDDHDNSNISITASQRQQQQQQQQHHHHHHRANRHFRHSLANSDTTRNSIAISDILSRDGSSVLGSSPVVPRQRTGLSRRGRG